MLLLPPVFREEGHIPLQLFSHAAYNGMAWVDVRKQILPDAKLPAHIKIPHTFRISKQCSPYPWLNSWVISPVSLYAI